MMAKSATRVRRSLLIAVLLSATGCGLDHPRLTPDAGSNGGGGAGAVGGAEAGLDGRDSGRPGGAPGSDADAGEDADAAAESCHDFSAELCMNPIWLDGTIAFERGAAVSDRLWAGAQVALDFWHASPVWNTEISFVDDAAAARPLLRFTADRGCGVVQRSSETVSFALGDCSNERHIAREIGVALGLPRLHQRTDRERHLLLAPETAFRCEDGEFFSKCPRPAELGSMADPSLQVMFAPTGSGEAPCALAPEGNYLYLPRVVDPLLGFSCESWARESPAQLPHEVEFTAEGAALAELYAAVHGWQPARAVGRDLGPDQPIDTSIAPGTHMLSPMGLVVTDGGFAAALLASAPNEPLELWSIERAGEWGQWRAGPRMEELASLYGFAAAARPGSDVIDAVVAVDILTDPAPPYLVHAHSGAASWVKLGDAAAAGLGIAPRAEQLVIYANINGELQVADSDRSTLSDWQPVLAPELARGVIGSPSVVDHAGAHHLVFVQSSNQRVAYTLRDELDTWSFPVELPTPPRATNVALAVAPTGSVHVLIAAFGLWYSTCAEAPCTNSGRWTQPVLIDGAPAADTANSFALIARGEEVDVVRTTPGYSGGASLWHKRWQPF